MLNRRIEKFFGLCKGDDLVKLSLDLSPLHAENCAIQENVFPSSQLRVETGSHFQQTTDTTVQSNSTFCRPGDLREYLEKRRLTRTIASDYSNNFSRRYLKTYIIERPDSIG